MDRPSHPVTPLVLLLDSPVGRGAEQQVITRLLARARVAESAVLVLVGEAGIGKTALLGEAVRGTDGMLLLRASGSAADRDVPFGGLLTLLRPVLHLIEQLPAPQADAVRVALALDAVTAAVPARVSDRFAVGAGVLGLLCAAAEQRALAVVVDDAHLLDEPSAQALAFAARAGTRGAHSVSAGALERAARLSTVGPTRAARLCAADEAAWRAGQGERATALAAEALTLDPASPVRTRAESVRGGVARRGSLEQARQILLAAADTVDADAPERAIDLLAEATLVCFFLGESQTGLDVAARLEALLAHPVTDRGRVLGTLAAGMARVVAGAGGTEQVRWSVQRLVRSPALRADTTLVAWQVLGPLWLRESGSSRELVSEAVAGVRQRVALGTLPLLLFLVGCDDATTDRWPNAEVGYAEGIRLARETGQTTDLVACLAGLGWLLARQGRETECAQVLAEASDLARRHTIALFEAWSLFTRGDCELALGRPEAAVTCLRELEHLLVERGVRDVDLSPGPELTDSLLRLGRPEEARSVARGYADRAVQKGQPWALARAERALGLVATEDEMDAHFEAAAGWYAQTLDVFEAARTDLARGSRLRRARRRVEARPVLARALETFDRLGATPWAALAAVEARATGQTARRRQVGAATDLTAQERQVAMMLADGMTTRQAAAAMFISPKTVEYHLRHVYSKLGVGSRAELAARLTEPTTAH